MIHHVALEVSSDQVEASLGFWRLLGFERVDAPASLADRAVWVECDGTQIHLLLTDRPTMPEQGHVALLVADYSGALAALRAAGIAVESRPEHWGAARAVVLAPCGHRVELMSAPPG